MTVAVYILRRLFGVFEAVSLIAWAGLELSAELTVTSQVLGLWAPNTTLSLTPIFFVFLHWPRSLV